jgi:hypothetical protein
MTHRLLLASLVSLLLVSVARAVDPAIISCSAAPAPTTKPVIQLAVLLDTSNSMDGLIDQAKTQLWNVVTDLARTKQHGQTPKLEVALYQYGNNGLKKNEGWVQQVLPFTDDLDSVSEKLFALRTNGGEEYCGWAIRSAVAELNWSASPDAYKTIFIAGNEPFSQGSVDFHQSCRDAIAKGIIVNTIHCGDEATGVAGGWRDGAKLADGSFMCINQNQAVVAIPAPQDKELAELSSAINTTYVAYGVRGTASQARQMAQDANAIANASSGAIVARAAAKATTLYSNGQWDLVDALKAGKKLEEIPEAELPENLKKMTPEQRKAYVDEQQAKRGEIQKKIVQLSDERNKFIAQKRREASTQQAGNTLDAAVINVVHEQVAKKNFEVVK